MTETATRMSQPSVMAPVPYRVRSRVTENRDSATLCLEPVGEPLPTPRPGEFMMMYAFGIGEVAISVSGDPAVTDGTITHTIRSVGAVSRAIGHGVSEAPRGLLYHRYEIGEDGLIRSATIVPPTAQNQAAIEHEMAELVATNLTLDDATLTSLCERSIRNHDPCISCSAHFLTLTVERR
jgi:Nickel-dependent hydrogenase